MEPDEAFKDTSCNTVHLYFIGAEIRTCIPTDGMIAVYWLFAITDCHKRPHLAVVMR